MVLRARARRFCRAGILTAIALLLAVAPLSATTLAQEASADGGRPEFRIGIGDLLMVFVYLEDTREECLVRPDGMISLPQLGDVRAAGLTPLELKGQIEERLKAFFEKPEVTVAVQEIHSYRIYMLGKVGSQTDVESVAPLRLLQALSIAGGLNEFANERIIVIRNENGGQRRIEVDLSDLLKGRGSIEQNIWLHPGDVVIAQ